MTTRTMSRWLVAASCALGVLAAGASAPALAQQKNIKAVFLANQDDEDYDGLLVFKDFVEAQSNGTITVEIFPGGQLCGNATECLESLQGGIIEVFLTTFGGFGNMVPEAQVMDLPYIFPSDRVAECALGNDTEFFAKLRDATLAKTGNIRLMTIGNTGGWRNFATVKRQIKSPADVAGLKLRTIATELDQTLVSGMGGAPTPVAWPELYTSLATGVVDGTKNGITDIVGMKFHEHLKYITLDGHAYMGALWMMNNDFFESLSAEEKKIVEDGFDALRWTTIVLPKRRQIEAYEAFKQAGGTVYVPTDEEKAEFVSAAKPVWDWYVGKFGDDWLNALQASIDRCEASIDAQRAS